jgi:hypothetical protein
MKMIAPAVVAAPAAFGVPSRPDPLYRSIRNQLLFAFHRAAHSIILGRRGTKNRALIR